MVLNKDFSNNSKNSKQGITSLNNYFKSLKNQMSLLRDKMQNLKIKSKKDKHS